MSPGRRKDAPPPVPRPPGEARDGLVTSEELFGDLVDSPPEPASRPGGGVRDAPIRVQVSEPSIPQASPGRRAKGPVLPEDVAALLDAFSEPGEAATRSAAATPQAPKPGGAPPPARPPKRAPMPPVPPGRGAPPKAAPKEGEMSFDQLLDGVEPSPEPATEAPETLRIKVPPLPIEAPPLPGRGSAPPAPTMEFDTLLDAVLEPSDLEPQPAAAPRRPPAPEPDLLDDVLPPPAAGLRTKFHVAQPKDREAPPDMSLDLAALADEALATAPPPPERPRPAEAFSENTFGPYRLLERVAVGGMAEVLRAKRTGVEGFEKVLAVKRILSHLSDNKEFVDMFINEAKMVAGLAHPNIVQIFDLGKLDKSYYIAMEYVHGRDLRTIQKRAKERGLRIPLDLAILIVSKVCAALEYAHRKKGDRGRPMKIVHRDISPQNILISFEGEVKLTDFGIAKAATKAPSTDAGALRGKLLYMSPEQAWGKAMDRRSDIFSLGIVFYELLTEQKPFLGNSEMSILETVRQCNVAPPTTVNPRIPEKLERVVMKALHRDPEQRYQDATDMFRDLDRVLPDRKAASGVELARFMEVLFDEQEREAAPPEEMAPGEERHVGHLEIELDTAPPGPPEPGGAGQDPMSIQKLLKRFGIK